MKRWAKRIGIALVSLLGLAILFGAVAERVIRARVARRYPALGRLVDVGGRRIQIDCRGAGSPTVVLESGLDTFGSLSWVAVHDSIAKTSRTCAYSRAGIMWSDAVSGAFDTKGVAQDLHEALTKAGEPAPFVVVGHSLGGPYALIFTDLYPADVAGLVFVDASHPDQVERLRRAAGTPVKDPTTLLAALASLAWTGIGRVIPAGGNPKIPAATRAAIAAYTPTSFAPAVRELKSLNATLEAAGKHRRLGERPLVVLTAMAELPPAVLKAGGMTREQGARFQAEWKTLHDDEATWSSRSRHEVVPDATHYIHLDRPDVVIKAVREVVDAVRNQGAIIR